MTKYKCDVCKEKYDKTEVTTECFDCYLKGCKIELDKQRIKFAEAVSNLKSALLTKGRRINRRIVKEEFDKIMGNFNQDVPTTYGGGCPEYNQDVKKDKGCGKILKSYAKMGLIVFCGEQDAKKRFWDNVKLKQNWKEKFDKSNLKGEQDTLDTFSNNMRKYKNRYKSSKKNNNKINNISLGKASNPSNIDFSKSGIKEELEK